MKLQLKNIGVIDLKNIQTSLNLSSQGNLKEATKTELLQFNHLIIFGFRNCDEKKLAPVKIKLKKSGELLIEGLDDIEMRDNTIKVYSDKKETRSLDQKEKEEGEKNE
ncbi:hypothetical protein SAMN03080606_01671 [Alkaliphilus peptidifermentans DSM 18978]|uniref:Uncharacterized protein n=1 Tax=Alkaliphilus peptidifermentans DSM 18978 TaxID=1120976 RepID=A0A1G5GFC1_9FIRM|nr:hypothetical protein SAMN03080606_01671 [Alkaliphilus peptidifermentans DSM 18978]